MARHRVHICGLWSFLAALLLVTAVTAQFPSSLAKDPDLKTVVSPVDGNITLRYKSPSAGTCKTAYSSQQQYTGYVTLPPFTLSPIQHDYSINTFFWFVEARNAPETAPLTIFMNGGPGSSSMVGFFQEVGPCEVVEISNNSLGTRVREWGWDRSSNMLFIDQPNQVGLSYDALTNGSLDLFTSAYLFPPADAPSNQPPYTFLNGTFSSNNQRNTANTTATAARAVWHTLQGFLGTFPEYNPAANSSQNSSVGVNLFLESYGGRYGPAFAAYFEKQNERLDKGELSASTTLRIHLQSLGILQGCVDNLIQGPFYSKFASNNTYGIEAVSLVDQTNMASSFLVQGGCRDQIQACRAAAEAGDPDGAGDNSSVNAICAAAGKYCTENVVAPYSNSGLSVYDISQSVLDPFPPNLYLEYLNTAEVQSSIGAPLNFTSARAAVTAAFQKTGDQNRGGEIAQLASLLDKGIRVALIYGDRDYVCNWQGGEAVSFSVASSTTSYLSAFNSAGYAPIITNDTYIGGVVRQVANFSFSRIYDAGHLIPAYQPETMFTLFTRIIYGADLSSGESVNLSTFRSEGYPNSTATNSAPPKASPTCYVRSVSNTCDEDQKEMLASGSGVIINGILYKSESDWEGPSSGSSGPDDDNLLGDAGSPGESSIPMTTKMKSHTKTTTTSRPATGVFTATSTPSMVGQRAASDAVSGLSGAGQRWGWNWFLVLMVVVQVVT